MKWNKGSEADLAGYKIHYGTNPRKNNCPDGSGYSDTVDAGLSSEYAFQDLELGRTYYFSISSYDLSKNESCFSEEVRKRIPNNFTYSLFSVFRMFF